ncbi:hypothetical protein Agub_g12983 [Astrephomene gubernaculifera]|uniref:Guanylyl cyclase n=1 Tax=Astrephomene gubernaculifera TaxID=47775 RepID=A0AAD3DZ33_9CHLO|nr:hypothetical protein Agub_g12983 [Astrephomene gubernaculifera]
MPPETMTLAGHICEVAQTNCHSGSNCVDPTTTTVSSQNPPVTSPPKAPSSWLLWPSATPGSSSSAPCVSTSVPCSQGVQSVVHAHVPHCKQHFNWDCGLACVQMILEASGFPNCDYQTLRHLCDTTSVWTVDLAHLLRRFGLRVAFHTITLGPNPAFANESFYMEHMEDDERRVSRLFREAAAAGIALQQRSVSGEELQSWLLSGECLIILLVDKRKLDPWLAAAADMCLPALCGVELGYLGHYVLLVGYDSTTAEYVVRDPAAAVSELRVSAAALDVARRSFGTDEDILVVGLAGSGGCCCVGGPQVEAAGEQGEEGE